MPLFMHQWTYRHEQIRAMLLERTNREEVVRTATEAFGGTLHHFFFSFGEFDGMAIAEFPTDETALACLMSIYGQGRLQRLKTTPLITTEKGQRAMQQAFDILDDTRE